MPLPPSCRALAPLLAAALLFPAAASAQSPLPPPSGDECFGFAFGRWTPVLDARAAGHDALPRDHAFPRAPSGRDWAAAISTGRDTTLMLFPVWWPAGVHVSFPAGHGVTADTVRGTAVALVADGRVRAPRAEVLAWRESCELWAVGCGLVGCEL